ncbi:MAG: serine hydrolase [Candidatus Tyrphobacter sp.]
MERRLFIGSGVAAIAALAAGPRLERWPFPGTVAIFAQRLHDARPFAQHDANRRLPSASVIKLVILVGVVREIDAGRLRWSDALRLSEREIVGASQSFGSARPGSRASVRHLVDAMVTQSDNTAANVLADRLSFAGVNAVAAWLDLEQTRLRRHFMDFAARARGIDNTTSAGDMGRVLLGIERGARAMPTHVASAKSCRAIVDVMLRQEDRDTIPAGVRRRVPIANKTGVLSDVRNDVAIVDPYGRAPYVVALLSQFKPEDARVAYARLRTIAARIDELA